MWLYFRGCKERQPALRAQPRMKSKSHKEGDVPGKPNRNQSFETVGTIVRGTIIAIEDRACTMIEFSHNI
jgi:hypothetical protein